MSKPWGTCSCGYQAGSAQDFSAHVSEHTGHPCPADWSEPRRGTRSYAQWSDKDAVLVLVNNSPDCPADVRLRYPGRHDARVPAGYEKVYLRSLPEVNKFEREHGVANHVMHYDRNGRALDDTIFGQKAVH